ncbi:histone acetyltransferase type B catalytic subunit [Coccidioides immitis RMSCC 3703]|uniref:Histone acetyltransferase type B catalytic subunit n=1 Tax=Coccidioides immitis RMSCC 3703 TaxID=454286 RepID=A0A0J8TGU6_COCIT|nr:histone acetyltransferase type B catalytic subunit [Coccidioides immitis RMSCC 3703]
MEDQSAWTCSSNDAVQVSIVQPKGDGKLSTLSTFYPEFTYSIFGDSETIFGYMGLMIQLRFAAHDLRSNVCISYDEKFKTVKDISAVDLNKILKPFLPEGAIANYEVWAGCLADPDVQELLERIQIFASLFIEGGTPIEINDPEWTLEKMDGILCVSSLPANETVSPFNSSRYEKLPEPPTPDASIYSFVGYGTTYKWYFYSPTSEKCKVSNGPFPYETVINLAELPSRLRISQFLILKPHQLSGHGTQLYQTIHRASLKDPTVYELTVEDPNEAFDSLRDTNDYHLLQPVFRHHNVTINANPYPATQSGRAQHRLVPTSRLIPVETLRDIRTKYKIAPTQFAHLVEMYLLSLIPMSHRGSHNVNLPRLRILKSRAPDEHDRRYYWWRMLVKQRLFKRHRDMLIQIDQAERVQKLEETLHNVEEGYENLLKAFGMKVTREPAESATPVTDEQQIQEEESGARAEHAVVRERTKRRFVVMEDEDEDDGDDQGVSSEGGGEKDNTNPPSKKARV